MPRIFDEWNPAGKPCPICGTHSQGKTVLAGIDGTHDGDWIEEVQPVHLDCLLGRLRFIRGTSPEGPGSIFYARADE